MNTKPMKYPPKVIDTPTGKRLVGTEPWWHSIPTIVIVGMLASACLYKLYDMWPTGLAMLMCFGAYVAILRLVEFVRGK